jgi:hypothetical protein
MILTRRLVVGALPAALLIRPAAAAPAPLPVPANGRLAFTVWRNGSRIGTHTASFAKSGDTLTVQTVAHFSVGIGPVKLYVYDYHVTETWNAGVLTGVTANTNDNGTRGTCSITRQGDRLLVDGSKSGRYIAPSGSLPGTHWNKAELAAPLINPENGVLMKFAVAEEASSVPPGGHAPAAHYALTGFATLDLWYDQGAQWVGARAIAKDKSVVEYHAA